MTEKLKLPQTVIEYETYGTNREEREYISPENVSKESIKRIKSAKIGSKILDILRSEQMAL